MTRPAIGTGPSCGLSTTLAVFSMVVSMVACEKSQTPEQVIDAYWEAGKAGDVERQFALLSKASQATTSVAELRQGYEGVDPGVFERIEHRVVKVDVGPDRTEVQAEIRMAGVDEPTSHVFELVKEEGCWRVVLPASRD